MTCVAHHARWRSMAVEEAFAAATAAAAAAAPAPPPPPSPAGIEEAEEEWSLATTLVPDVADIEDLWPKRRMNAEEEPVAMEVDSKPNEELKAEEEPAPSGGAKPSEEEPKPKHTKDEPKPTHTKDEPMLGDDARGRKRNIVESER